MSNDKGKPGPVKGQAQTTAKPTQNLATTLPASGGAQKPPGPISPATAPSGPAPLFRRIDWLTFLVTTIIVFIGYWLTLAPELTLEDSGELATGSFYAGIPHPPGYPVWTIYTWIWTRILPFGNIAWRVSVGVAVGSALAAGLLGMLVSRGSSLLIEGIEDLKAMAGQWESAICMVSGFVAGMLIGFNGFMWSQSVIVEVYGFSVASFMIVMLCLLRWIYAPFQRRYLYLALFFHGICFTNHQTLIVAAMGLEVAIAAANFRLGRYLWLGNSAIFFAGLILKSYHILTALEQNLAVYTVFQVVGACSIALYAWFAVLTKETFLEFCIDASFTACLLLLATAVGAPSGKGMLIILALAALVAAAKFVWDTRKLGLELLIVLGLAVCWVLGAAFYFYMPLAGMTDPPMQWGYPRTVEGFIHAFTRGQYEKTNPTNIIGDPMRFLTQLGMMGRGVVEEFNWVYMFLALVPFLFFRKMHRRERAWIIGIVAIYFFLGVLLLILLNPPPDKQAQQLIRVFFTASHTMVSLLVGYGLTLVAAYMATHYERFRSWGLIGGAVAIALALFSFAELTSDTYFGPGSHVGIGTLFQFVGHVFSTRDQYGLPVYASLLLIGLCVAYVICLFVYRLRAPLAITLLLFALMPLHSIMTHWSDNEQRGHWFGYWFGHDMFTPPFKGAGGKPLYPEMTKDAILYGGTDPGRFCPTYMIFCDSFVPHDQQPKEDQTFDRRDVYIITQNALADGTYLNYIRAHYNRSKQIDPPFFQELFRSEHERMENYTTNFVAQMAEPLDTLFEGLGDKIEKERRTYTSWFTDKDFTDLPGFLRKLREQADPVSKFIYDGLTPDTQKALAGNADPKSLLPKLEADLNALLERELVAKTDPKRVDPAKAAPLYDPQRFKNVSLSEYLQDFIKENPQSHTRVRLNRLLLEAAYPKEIARSLGGIYPDREMYIATPEDSQRCFQEYMADASRRMQLNQLKPGEDVRVDNGRVQVSGQVAVMAINGLLTKVMFDHNPKNEFFVEESFPLDWMYPHLTPFGIIMKINRQPLHELGDDICKRDHQFWKEYSKRLTGDFIDYDTPVKDIAAFIEKVYLRRDFTGFTGDRKFVRDDQAQKAFSKLRSSIGGVYAWRATLDTNRDPIAVNRMIKEADFAFKQAFAFCPYSPEAVFRYVNLLLGLHRMDDAYIIGSTCLKLDPYNGQVIELVKRLEDFKKGGAQNAPAAPAQNFAELEKTVEDNPTNFQAYFDLASTYLQSGQPERAIATLDRVLNSPAVSLPAIQGLLQAYSTIHATQSLQTCADKLAGMVKTNPTNFQATVLLATAQRELNQIPKAVQTLDAMVANSNVSANAVLGAAAEFNAMHDMPRIEKCLAQLTKLTPESPEAWYDLAAIRAGAGKSKEAVPDLKRALELNASRHRTNPAARDLALDVRTNPAFAALRASPDFPAVTN
jgi:thioredoxin-like negative regulator of GroEL